MVISELQRPEEYRDRCPQGTLQIEMEGVLFPIMFENDDLANSSLWLLFLLQMQ